MENGQCNAPLLMFQMECSDEMLSSFLSCTGKHFIDASCAVLKPVVCVYIRNSICVPALICENVCTVCVGVVACSHSSGKNSSVWLEVEIWHMVCECLWLKPAGEGDR